MSYEPTLVILKSSFDKHKELLLDGTWQYEIKEDEDRGEEGLTVMEYLQSIIKLKQDKPVKIAGIELYLVNPTFTSFNMQVRKKLTELDVEYTTSY